MRLPAIILCTIGCALSFADAPKPFAELTPADGDTIVFLGDSITAQALYTQYVENYFFTRYPQKRLHFHNAGVSGDTVADALVRFDAEVAKHRPKYVAVLLGMNDGAAKVFEPALFDNYRAGMAELAGKIRAIGATPILLAPTMYDLRATQLNPKNDSRGRGGYYNGVLALYGSWLREFAAEQGAGFVDFHGPLNQFTLEQRKSKPDFTLIPDGIHPEANGQIIMAYQFASDLGLLKRCSITTITRQKDGTAGAKAVGAKVTDAAYTAYGLVFDLHPSTLPLPVPEDAATGARLIPLGHRLSYEALYLHGLPDGKYRMLINETEVGTYSAAELASKIEIEENAWTPQYQQAVRVAALNAKRQAESELPIRELWRFRKIVDRVRADLAAHPDDEQIKRRLAVHGEHVRNFDADLAKYEAAGQAIEDEIYRANQPQPLHFRLERISDMP